MAVLEIKKYQSIIDKNKNKKGKKIMKKNNYAALERKITALANRLGNIDYEVGGVVREKNQDLYRKRGGPSEPN